MKNLIGINGDKSWIAHHRRGIDEYPSLKLLEWTKWKVSHYSKALFPGLSPVIFKGYHFFIARRKKLAEQSPVITPSLMEGNWHGNDTVWRTIVDLNNIIFFCDKIGTMTLKKQRNYLSIIDGIIGMEKEGPMHGTPKHSSILIGGFHPVSVDYVATRVMGLAPIRIPNIKEGLTEKYWRLTNFSERDIKTNDVKWKNINLNFEPTKGWKGNIERVIKND